MATAEKKHSIEFDYPLLGPQNIDGGKTGNYLKLDYYRHVKLNIVLGAIAAASSLTIKRAKSSDALATAEDWDGWDSVRVNANYSLYKDEDASPTEAYTKTTVSSYTKSTGTTSNQHWKVEFDAIQLDPEGAGWDCFTVAFSDPTGSVTDNACVVATLSDPRFASNAPPSPIY